MSPEPTPLNPSQAVERIREIIVGRHLERLEERVARLESSAATPMFSTPMAGHLSGLDGRTSLVEQSLRQLIDETRQEVRQSHLIQQTEIQRIAAQIQEIHQTRSAEISPEYTQKLEHQITQWLTGWQHAFQRHMDQRDQQIQQRIETHLEESRHLTQQKIDALQESIPDRAQIEAHFGRIAAAAKALAECASAPIFTKSTETPLQ
ncbi:hypothetical protein JIN85_11155 [Luteolibacter pohnpeiensis]|uniref:Uncharacterized protein n=1 Tax=Luteolibacter pohnpeiensis TaxID=454153 RepID=A0A934S8U9_9BACT|nr:hypothetical protein [Luteolibacter pohnpeiensis]MBK1882976.1 hypothetical protein [Luteolibacter pohnpeiensis]